MGACVLECSLGRPFCLQACVCYGFGICPHMRLSRVTVGRMCLCEDAQECRGGMGRSKPQKALHGAPLALEAQEWRAVKAQTC
jgi:hypothetical protein